jgi:hypothetical protein
MINPHEEMVISSFTPQMVVDFSDIRGVTLERANQILEDNKDAIEVAMNEAGWEKIRELFLVANWRQ